MISYDTCIIWHDRCLQLVRLPHLINGGGREEEDPGQLINAPQHIKYALLMPTFTKYTYRRRTDVVCTYVTFQSAELPGTSISGARNERED